MIRQNRETRCCFHFLHNDIFIRLRWYKDANDDLNEAASEEEAGTDNNYLL